jgi:glycosyltransferase involved in cell wall biosynthesis
MRICVVIDDYLPDSTRVGAKMMHELCVEFVRRGHAVTVVAPQSVSPKVETSTLDGVALRRFPAGATKNVPKWKRALNESLLPWRAWRSDRAFFRANPHDLIVYYSPCIFWAPLVRRLKRLWQARSFLVLRDFFPQWAIDNGMLREGSPVTRYFRWCEAASYREADCIGIQSPRNLEAFRVAHPQYPTLALLYNWAEDRPGSPATPSWRERLGLGGKVVFFYGGAITNQQDIPNLVRLAERLRDDPAAHFLIVGDGYDLPNVRDIVRQRGLRNVTIHPAVDQESFRELLAEVDIGLFSLARCHTTHNFPGKVLGYLVQGLPVLGSVNPGNDLQDVITEAGAGFVAVNGEDDALAAAALRLLRDTEARRAAGEAARRLLASTFSVAAAAALIERAAARPPETA